MKKIVKSLLFILITIISLPLPIRAFATPVHGDLGKGGEVMDPVEIITGSYTNAGDVQVKKIVTKTDTVDKYNIEFQVRGKNSQIIISKEKPIYVVVVLDSSGSMDRNTTASVCTGGYWEESGWSNRTWHNKGDCKSYTTTIANKYNVALDNARTFANSLLQNVSGVQLALVSFSNNAYIERGFKNANFDNVYFPKANEGTMTNGGLILADYLLSDSSIPSNAEKYVVLISDGVPTYYIDSYKNFNGNIRVTNSTGSYSSKLYNRSTNSYDTVNNHSNPNRKRLEGTRYENGMESSTSATTNSKTYALQAATELKKHSTIYTIGYNLGDSSSAEQGRQTLRSIATDSAHFLDANGETLATKFSTIFEQISQEHAAGTDAVLTDNIGSQFVLTTSFHENTKSLSLNTITEEWASMGSFTVDAKDVSEDNWYNINEGFTLKYKDENNEEQTITYSSELEQPQAYLTAPKYTINYWYKDTDTYVLKISDVEKTIVNEVITITDEQIENHKNYNNINYNFVNVDKTSITIVRDSSKNVINVYYEKPYTLSIKKKLVSFTGDSVDNKLMFNFEVTLMDSKSNPISGTFNYKLNNGSEKEIIFNSNGKANISLKNNDTLVFINLPRNIKYEIKEKNADAYIVEIKYNNQNTIASKVISKTLSENSSVEYTNTIGYELPEAGSHMGLIMLIMVAFLFGAPIINKIYNLLFIKRISWR